MKIKNMILVSIFAVLSALGARLMIPVPFVPFTLQTLICMLAGIILGPRLGAASMALYMLMGLAGIPVFTSAAGPGAVLAPSFGYVIGFIAGAWVSGAVTAFFRRSAGGLSVAKYFTAAMAGVLFVYAIGVVYLYFILNYAIQAGGTGVWKVLSIGLFSTIGGDVVKAAAAALIADRLEKSGALKNS